MDSHSLDRLGLYEDFFSDTVPLALLDCCCLVVTSLWASYTLLVGSERQLNQESYGVGSYYSHS